MARLRIDREHCAGHARCSATAPELFLLDDDGYVAIDDVELEPSQLATARRGESVCPERVIKVEE